MRNWSGNLNSYHQTVMPCRIMVWEDREIFVSMSNPEIFLPAFFFDAPRPENLETLFLVFATLVYNEIAMFV